MRKDFQPFLQQQCGILGCYFTNLLLIHIFHETTERPMIKMIQNCIKNCEKVTDFAFIITGSAKQMAMHGQSSAVSFAVLLGITSITV